MQVILGMFIGIIICNFVVCCVLIGADEDYAAMIGAGIIGLIVFLVGNIIDIVKTINFNHKYCSVLIDPNGDTCYCKPLPYDKQSKLFDKGYRWNKSIAKKYKPSDGWDLSLCASTDTPNIRFTPLAIAKAESLYKINNKTLRKLLTNK